MPQPVRLGLIGVGRWGRIYLRTLARHPVARLVAVASGNPATDGELPAGCARYADWRDLIARPDLDGIIIATPPASHAPIASEALAAGLAVLVEKPLCLDPAEARALNALSVATSGFVLVDHIHLFAPAFRELRVQAGRLGAIRSISGLAGNRGPYRRDASVLWDWGPHDVAMILSLAGRPTAVAIERTDRVHRDDGSCAETVRVALQCENIDATFTVSTLIDKTRRLTVTCDGGTLVYDDLAAAKLTLDGRPIPHEPTPALDVVIGEFCNGIQGHPTAAAGLDLAVAVVEVLSRCESLLTDPA